MKTPVKNDPSKIIYNELPKFSNLSTRPIKPAKPQSLPPKSTQPQKPIPIQVPKPEPNQPTEKSPLAKIKYKYAGNESITQIIANAIPKQFIPTSRLSAIFGGIFVAVLLLTLLQFPFKEMMAGNIDVIIEIGFPWHFFKFGLATISESPLKIPALLGDLLLYLIIAYAIDVIINLVTNNSLLKSEDEIKGQPTVFKDRKPSLAEKVTKKVLEK
jgi:hypothetical protein